MAGKTSLACFSKKTAAEMTSVGIVSTGLGNVASIRRMIEKAGGEATIVENPGRLKEFQKIILPGVGHFDNGIKKLSEAGFRSELISVCQKKNVKIMGICLGMQLLCKSSEEGTCEGLGLIDATVEKFRSDTTSLKIPHMGWNTVNILKDNALLKDIGREQRFYFVHSFRVVPRCASISLANCEYGVEFCAAFQDGNIFGVQFHPEKSHKFGLRLIKNFLEL